MTDHLNNRPSKTYFPVDQQIRLRNKTVDIIKSKLLPDEKIIRIILIGSSVSHTFGQYEPPGFRGSLYSDFDFIVFTEDDYKISDWFIREPDGKPFSDNELNLAYRNKNVVDNQYDVETFFMRRNTMDSPEIQDLAEKAGIPLKKDTTVRYLTVYGAKN
ncbi:hypothetical protein KKA33_04860 [Patescibacteria group bacterium]|nr:hypothetical protein [Patescibacteria group bacterium]